MGGLPLGTPRSVAAATGELVCLPLLLLSEEPSRSAEPSFVLLRSSGLRRQCCSLRARQRRGRGSNNKCPEVGTRVE